MNELDMSRPGSELFPESAPQGQYNSYQDVNMDQVVMNPLDTGVKGTFDDADQGQLSDKEMNFRALREETAKFKQESEYWRGQAEAFSKMPTMQQPAATQQDAYSALDWEDPAHVRKAFEAVREDNQRIRNEFKDALSAIETKTKHQDWDNLVTQHVPQLTSQNKLFAEMIQNVSNPHEAAYLLSQLNAKATQTAPTNYPPEYANRNGNGQRAIANAQKPHSLSSVGGQGQLSAADYYASMSDEDFHKIAARNLANI